MAAAEAVSPALRLAPAARVAPPRGGWLGWVEQRIGLTPTGLVVVGAALVGWTAGYVIGGKGLYILVYSGVLVLVISYVTARRRRAVRASRSELRRRAREGQVMEVELSLESPRRLGMFTLEERLHPLLGQSVRISVATVTPAEPWTYRYFLRPRLRGVYSIGPLVAIWTDAFGLARAEQVLVEPIEILVHPNTEPVLDRPLTRQLEDPPIRPPKTKPWPTGFEFYGMRDYVAGDDLRRVVWKAVARTGRMLVRESEQGVTDQVNILVDTDADWHRPGDPSDTFESAIRVAASVGTHHIKNGFSVSLYANDGRLAEKVRGPRARVLFLDELARLQRGTEILPRGIELLLRERARNAHNVIVTPSFSRDSAARASLIIQQGASVLVAFIAWEDADPGSIHRATEIGAEVIQVRPGAALQGVFAHALGTGLR